MDGIDVLKKVITDSRFWAALWVFLQIPLSALVKDNTLGQEMLAGANAFVAVLMAIIFGVSKSAAVGQEVVQKERRVLALDLDYSSGMTDEGVKSLVQLRRAEAAQAKAAGDIADTDFQP